MTLRGAGSDHSMAEHRGRREGVSRSRWATSGATENGLKMYCTQFRKFTSDVGNKKRDILQREGVRKRVVESIRKKLQTGRK